MFLGIVVVVRGPLPVVKPWTSLIIVILCCIIVNMFIDGRNTNAINCTNQLVWLHIMILIVYDIIYTHAHPH